jgi:hypothetical protein
VSERDLGQAGAPAHVEEPGEDRAPQVEVDEDHALARAGKRHGEVAHRRRLTLALDRARHEDDLRAALEIHEVEVRLQHAEGLGLHAVRIRQHRELVAAPEPSRRLRQAREQRQPETLDLVGGPHPRVEGIPQKGEAEAEADPEEQSEDAVPHGLGLNLPGGVRRPHERGRRGLQRLDRAELLFLLGEVLVERRLLLSFGLQLVEPGGHFPPRSDDGSGIELALVPDELPRVDGGKLDRRRGVPIVHEEAKEVGVGVRRDGRSAEEGIGIQPVHARRRYHALGEGGNPRELGLCLCNPLRKVIDAWVRNAVQAGGEVLATEQHVRGRLVKRLLAQGQEHGSKRNQQDRLRDDPLTPPDHAQVVAQGRVFVMAALRPHYSPLSAANPLLET